MMTALQTVRQAEPRLRGPPMTAEQSPSPPAPLSSTSGIPAMHPAVEGDPRDDRSTPPTSRSPGPRGTTSLMMLDASPECVEMSKPEELVLIAIECS